MINSRYSTFLLAALSALVAVYPLNHRVGVISPPKSRTLEILNKSGKNLIVEWVNPKTGDLVPFANFENGEHTKFHSYVNHTFAIHESEETCSANNDASCEVRFITINENNEQGKDGSSLLVSNLLSFYQISRLTHHCSKLL
jgi:hypothetical protein